MENPTHPHHAMKKGSRFRHKKTGALYTVTRMAGGHTYLSSVRAGGNPLPGEPHQSIEVRVSADELGQRYDAAETTG